MGKFRKKLRAFWKRRQLDRDLEDELRFHLEMKREQADSALVGERWFGNPTAIKEICRELWTFTKLETWWQDIHYGIRTLARTPGFTLVAVSALALGIGADTAVFTIASGAFSWNLGLDHIDRIVLIGATDASRHHSFGQSYPDFRDLRAQVKSLAGLAAYEFIPMNVSDGSGLPERYFCARMSANGFAVSEQKPALGRDFTAEDERVGAPPVVMLAYHVWQDRYGMDTGIIGKAIRLNEVSATVVGVMPAGRRFPEEADLWTPLIPDASLEKRDRRNLALFGRLADGSETNAARAELKTLSTRLASQYPNTNEGLRADVEPIASITGAYASRPMFAVMWGAVGFVLLIACADVANMLLARGAARSREISIRVAIGAGRARILRQLLIESIVLSVAGGFLGWLVALGGLRWFDRGTAPAPKPVWLHLTLDAGAFAYLAAISIGTGILFGLAPALRLSKVDIHTALKDGGHGAVGRRRGLTLSNLLVALQMALCIVLLAGAGVMIRSAVNLYNAPLGVNTSNLLTMHINLPVAKYPQPADQAAFHRDLQARLEALPGVDSAAVASNLPLGSWRTYSYQLEGVPPDSSHTPQLGAIVVSPSYFRVMNVKPWRGRTFTEADSAAAAAIIVNESFAQKFWPLENPLGKSLRLIKDREPQRWLTVVGVVPDILQNFREKLRRDPLIYLPYGEEAPREMFLVSRTRVPPATLADAFRRAVQSVDESLPVYDMQTLDNRLAQSRLVTTLLSAMFSVFAAIALLLASVGLYAVIAHSVGQRSQEIGVRMALGGSRGDILRMVFAQGLRPLAWGMLIGTPAAFAVTHIARAGLIGVSPGDPITFLAVLLILPLAGILGCAVPARRAVRVDPVVALRCE